MLDGVMLLWFLLSALSLLFVVVDIRSTPASPVLKWSFVLLTAYPMNWWLVSRHMKHGMITARSPGETEHGGTNKGMHGAHAPAEHDGSTWQKGKPAMGADVKPVSKGALARMTILSFLVFGLGLSIAAVFGGL